MPRNLPGPEWEGAEFRQSPAYAEFRDALKAAGCRRYVDLIQQPLDVQRAFHDDWTARMRARVAGPARPLPRRPEPPRGLAAEVGHLWGTGMSDARIAAAIGRTEQRVQQIRTRLGLPARGRAAKRGAVLALAADGTTDAAIGARLALSPAYVGEVRRAAGIRVRRSRPVSPAQAARRAEIRRLLAEGASYATIVRHLGVSRGTIATVARALPPSTEAA